MSDIVSDLAAKSGLSADQAKKGLGAVLSYVKESVPEDTFAQVSSAVPDSDEIMAAAGPHEEESRGIIGTIKGAASKLFGGGASGALISRLSHLGISAEQAQSFLPHVMEVLKSKLPDSVAKHLTGLFPAHQESPA
jgi:hypothetical protein